MKKALFLPLLLLIVTNLSAQCLLDYSNYKLVWGDEFNYPTNDIHQLQNKWLFNYVWQTPQNTGINVDECDRYFWDADANVTLTKDDHGNGYVNLCATHLSTPVNINGINYDRSAGILVSKYDDDCPGSWEPYGFYYGIFEIRCKVSPEQSGLSAFWLNGHGYETDLFETTKDWGSAPRTFFSTTQPSSVNNYTGCSTFYDWLFSDPANNFHTYSLAWTNKKLTWFIDGMEVRTNDISYFQHDDALCLVQKMAIIASVHAQCWSTNNFDKNGKTGPMVIDYIRVYRPNNYPGTPLPSNYSFPDYKTTETFNNYNISTSATTQFSAFGNTDGLAAVRSNNLDRVYFVSPLGNLQYAEGSVSPNPGWTYNTTNVNNASTTGSSLTIDDATGNVFYRGTDGEIWVYGNWSGSYTYSSLDISGLYANDVSTTTKLVFTSSPYPRVYYKNTNNKLAYFEYNPQTNPQWIKYTTSYTVTDDICRDDFSTGVYFRGADNEIWAYWVVNGSTTCFSLDPNHLYPDNVYGSLAARDSKVYYTDASNNIWYWEWSSTQNTWTKYQSIVPNARGYIVPRPNYGCFYISTDNNVYSHHIWQNQPVYNTLNFLYSDKKAAGYLTPSSSNNERLFYIDANNQLRYFEWGNCENLNPPCSVHNDIGLKHVLSPTISGGKATVNVYPNPFTDYVEITQGKNTIKNVVVYDVYGRKVLQTSNSGEESVILDTRTLSPGNYYYIINCENNIQEKGKLVKQ